MMHRLRVFFTKPAAISVASILIAVVAFVSIRSFKEARLSDDGATEIVADTDNYRVTSRREPNSFANSISDGLIPGAAPPERKLPVSCKKSSDLVRITHGFDNALTRVSVTLTAKQLPIQITGLKLQSTAEELPKSTYHLYCTEPSEQPWPPQQAKQQSGEDPGSEGLGPARIEVYLDANTARFDPNHPVLVNSNLTRTIEINAHARAVNKAYQWSVTTTLRVGKDSVDVVIDDHGSPFRTATDGKALDIGDSNLPPEYRLQDMPKFLAGTAYLSAVWAFPPAANSHMRQTGPFITYTVMNSGWNESYAPAMDGWWADRQIAWQRELLADNPPAIQSPSESCDDVFRQLPPDSVAGFGGQTVYVGIGGSNDATLKAARMRIQNISEDNRTDSQKTEVNCANARSMSRGSYINESRIIRASFSNESDHWRSGGIYQRVGNVLMPLGGQYPPYAVLAVSVDNLFHSSIVSYTLEVDVQSSNGQIITLPIDDAGMPFRQGSAGQYSIGKIATYCATDTSGPAWHVRPGSEFIDGESLPCIAPKSPSRPN